MWRRRRKAASASLSAALYSVHHGLYSEAVVSSIASAVALAEVGQFRETVQYVQKAAKALYESAREVFEQVTYGKYGEDNVAIGFAVARGDAPEVREADAERFAAVIRALTGEEPKVYRRENGQIVIECVRVHLDGFMRYAKLADTIARWLEETSR